MGARADWHVKPVAVDERDPFVDAPASATPIDLSTDAPALDRRLVELVQEESALFEAGVTCAIRDSHQSCCHACPVNRSGDRSPQGRLCRVGMEQERVVTQMVVNDSEQQ